MRVCVLVRHLICAELLSISRLPDSTAYAMLDMPIALARKQGVLQILQKAARKSAGN